AQASLLGLRFNYFIDRGLRRPATGPEGVGNTRIRVDVGVFVAFFFVFLGFEQHGDVLGLYLLALLLEALQLRRRLARPHGIAAPGQGACAAVGQFRAEQIFFVDITGWNALAVELEYHLITIHEPTPAQAVKD